ncbi:hypothetical protein BDW71DRAFT_185472 [Aspergillus fruticulosus]
MAEDNKVGGIFFCGRDRTLGVAEKATGARWHAWLCSAVQFPVSDPVVLLSATAYATENVSFIYTSLRFRGKPLRLCAHHLYSRPPEP